MSAVRSPLLPRGSALVPIPLWSGVSLPVLSYPSAPLVSPPPVNRVPTCPVVRTLEGRCRRLGRAATGALHDELALAPKPGLVSFVDSGSHADMDARTFVRSLFALRRFFPQVARLGAAGAPFGALEAAGIAAEARMLTATGGVNTHRGAIFLLGLLCAAGGALAAAGTACTEATLRWALDACWGDALRRRANRAADSHGSRAARRFGLHGAGAEAAAGFPTLFDHVLPAVRAARRVGLDDRQTRLQALFTAIAVLDDTTLAHRGGLAGLRFAQASAHAFLVDGGAARPQALAHALALHREFVRRRLSPGGAADLLAAACWIERVTDAAARDDAARGRR